MILSLYLVSQDTCAAQFASHPADVDTATLLGFFADGDAGDDSDNFDDDLHDNFKEHEFSCYVCPYQILNITFPMAKVLLNLA